MKVFGIIAWLILAFTFVVSIVGCSSCPHQMQPVFDPPHTWEQAYPHSEAQAQPAEQTWNSKMPNE